MKLDNVSHFDGISNPEINCSICGLTVDMGYKAENNLCLPCSRYASLERVNTEISKFALPALFMGILIMFFDSFSQYSILLPFLLIIVFIPMILTSSKITIFLYKGFDESAKINHLLRFSNLLEGSFLAYYEQALDAANNSDSSKLNPTLKRIVVLYLVQNVLMNGRPNPTHFMEDWSEALELDKEELLQIMFNDTEIIEGFSFHKGVSLLPDLWPYIPNDEVLFEIMDELEKACTQLDEAATSEKKYFLEDMYLVEDELYETIEAHDRWHVVADVLDEFEPETPPQNTLQSFMAQAQEAQRLQEQRQAQAQLKKQQGLDDNTNQ